jgi:copper chaperone CopZ
MFRKVLAASTAALLVSLTLSVAPASAAVKNGTPCSKAGATTKSGGTTFKCVKYALVKNSKLTWRSNDCVNTVNAFVKAQSNVAAAKIETDKTVATVDEAIALLQETITVITPLVNAAVAKYQGKIDANILTLAKLNADTANKTQNASVIATIERANKSWNTAIIYEKRKISTYTSKINLLKNQRNTALNNFSIVSSASSTAQSTASTVCS